MPHNPNQFTQMMKEADIPGVSYGYFSDGKPFKSYEFGEHHDDKEAGGPVTNETQLFCASLSKPVFSCLVLMLINANKHGDDRPEFGAFKLPKTIERFDLDTPLYHVLPELVGCYHKYKAMALTARLVLSHATGIPICHGKAHPHFDFEPGKGFAYTGLPYLYLQTAIERLTRQSTQALCQHYIFDPLKMTNSSFLRLGYSEENNYDIELSQSPLFPVDTESRAVICANSLRTTPSDYALFVTALLNDPSLADTFEPGAELINDRWASDLGVDSSILKNLAWGLGWGVHRNADGIVDKAFHFGDMDNNRAFVIIDIPKKSGVVFFANGEFGLALTQQVLIDKGIKADDILTYMSQKFAFAVSMDIGWKNERVTRGERVGRYLTYRQGLTEYNMQQSGPRALLRDSPGHNVLLLKIMEKRNLEIMGPSQRLEADEGTENDSDIEVRTKAFCKM
jgi:CubicO group peptidase (beta-lactamase class C family)